MQISKPDAKPMVWRLRVFTGDKTEKGSPVFRSVTFRGSAKDADAALRQLVAEEEARRRGGTTSVEPSIVETVGTLLDQWLPHLESLGRSPTTMRKYRQIVDAEVRPALGDVPLSDLTARDLDRLYAKLTKRGLKSTSVRRVHALLSASLHQAEKWDLVDVNVARRASPPPIHAEQVEALTPEQVLALIRDAEAIEPTMANLLFLAALTGCRRGELCGLRWSDVDWRTGSLRVERSVFEEPGGGWEMKSTKSHQARRVALGDVGVALLRRHRAGVDAVARNLGLEVISPAFMFSRSPQCLEPIRPDVVSKFVGRIGGGTIHLHQLRHYSATQLIGSGHDVRTVAGRLGHADPSVTLRVYAHARPERDQDAATALGRTLASAV